MEYNHQAYRELNMRQLPIISFIITQ
jgi:hypothetical protein